VLGELKRGVNQRSRAFARTLGLGPPKGASIPIEWGRRVCGGLFSTLGVARCGRSAGCVLCALWAVSAAVWGGVPCGGKHIIIIDVNELLDGWQGV